MKTNLKDNIWIEGFNNQGDLGHQCFSFAAYHLNENILYSGKTSDIPEELAKECVKWEHIVLSATAIKTGSGQTYKDYSGEKRWYIYSAKESIQSACSQPYCIIYKTK